MKKIEAVTCIKFEDNNKIHHQELILKTRYNKGSNLKKHDRLLVACVLMTVRSCFFKLHPLDFSDGVFIMSS